MFALVHGPLECARGIWTCIGFVSQVVKSVGGINRLRFSATYPNLQLLLLHLRTAFFEAHLLSPLKIWQLWVPQSFMEPSYTIS